MDPGLQAMSFVPKQRGYLQDRQQIEGQDTPGQVLLVFANKHGLRADDESGVKTRRESIRQVLHL